MHFEDLGDAAGAICIGLSVLLVVAAVASLIGARRLDGAPSSSPRAMGVAGTLICPPEIEAPLS